MGQNSSIDIIYLIEKIKRNWWLILICSLSGFFISYIILKYIPKEYRITASIRVEATESNIAENLFENLKFIEDKLVTSNEMVKLRSFRLVQSTLKSIHYQVGYFENGLIFEQEIFSECPFTVKLDSTSFQLINNPIRIYFLDQDKYVISTNLNDGVYYNPGTNRSANIQKNKGIAIQDTVLLDEQYKSEFLSFGLHLKNETIDLTGRNYHFKIFDPNFLTQKYIQKLNISPVLKDATILQIKLNSNIPDRDLLFLREHLNLYMNQNYDLNNVIAENIIDFIERQMIDITDSLKNSELELQSFRDSKKIINLDYESKLLFDELKSLENKHTEELTTYKYYEYIESNIHQKNPKNIVVPTVIGLNDPILNNLITTLKEYTSERISMSTSANEKNPKLSSINENIENIKSAISENIKSLKKNSELKTSDIENRMAELQKSVSSIPEDERILLSAQRKFDFNDNIYNYFMQKRAEAYILKETNTPIDLIIDQPRIDDYETVYPNRKLIMGGFIGLGFFLPIFILILSDLVSNKFLVVEDLLQLLPDRKRLIGVIPAKRVFLKRSNSLDASASVVFQSLAQRLLGFGNKNCVGIVSSTKKEGKTYICYHIGHSLSKLHLRTLLIDFELTGNSLALKFGQQGLSLEKTNVFEDLSLSIEKSQTKNLFMLSLKTHVEQFIYNPHSFLQLLEQLKSEYDFIIIDFQSIKDSPLFMAVQNDLNICLFIVRQGKTKIGAHLPFTMEENKNNLWYLFNESY